MDDTTRSYYEAYADGVNAYLASRSGAELSLEYAVIGLQNPDYAPEPWEPADSVAWLKAMAWDLRGNIEDETERSLLAAQLSGGTDGEGTDPTATEDTLAKLYPDYPFDENPVIVPKISTVPTLGTDAEPAAFTPTETDGEVQQASTTIEWRRRRASSRQRAFWWATSARASARTPGSSPAPSPRPGCPCSRTTRTSEHPSPRSGTRCS